MSERRLNTLVRTATRMVSGRGHRLATGWATRLGVELVTAALSFVGGALVAHRLGPAGKGEVSTLGYLVAVVTTTGALGLGEAAATIHGRRGIPLSRSLSASTTMLAFSSLVATSVIFVAAKFQLESSVSNNDTVTAVCLSVPAIIFARALLGFLDAEHRIVLSSMLRLVMSSVTALTTWLFVIGLDRGVAGALVAPVAGALTVCLLAGIILVRLGGSFRPRIDRAYLSEALRYGPPLMTSVMMIVLAGRADLFLVRGLAGNKEAGLYSVALTMSQLAIYPADSLLGAAYPRLAALPDDHALPFIMRLTRTGVLAATLTAGVLALIMPVAIPTVFGDDFRPSVGPSLILLVSVILYGAQSLLTRSRAAAGHTGLAVQSFGTSLVVMVVFDVALIPVWGMSGAATASVLSVFAGLMVTIRAYRRLYGSSFRVTQLVPRPSDLLELRSLLARPAGSVEADAEISPLDPPVT